MVAVETIHHGEKMQTSKETRKQRSQAQKRIRIPTEDAVKVQLQRLSTTLTDNGSTASMHRLSNIQVLMDKLQKLITKQEQLTTLQLPSIGNADCIGVAERNSAVTSIKSMQAFYDYGSHTLADAVSILDRFLSKVKVKGRYLSCVTAAAFYLSTKMNEEVENEPSASDLSRLHRHMWKPSDLKRMERTILEKLGWNLFPSVSCLAFVHLIYSLLHQLNPRLDQTFLELLIERTEMYINYSSCASFMPSTLALAILHQCLKRCQQVSPVTDYILLCVQSVCLISDAELQECQSAISMQLELFTLHPATHPLCLPLPRLTPRPNLIVKPSYYGASDLPTIDEVSFVSEFKAEQEMLIFKSVVVYPCRELTAYVPCVQPLTCRPCVQPADLKLSYSSVVQQRPSAMSRIIKSCAI